MFDETHRREFLKQTAGTAVALGLAGSTRAVAAGQDKDKDIVIGCVGVAGRGTADMNELMKVPGTRIGAVCDVYKPHLDRAVETVRSASGQVPKTYHDFRELLAQKDLDAVVVATPPHWHALIAIEAMKAGKDVYIEKPMCIYPAEARALVKVARETGRMTQVGTQVHASENYRRVVEVVQSGVLGKISAVRTYVTLNEAPVGPVGNTPDSDVPPGLDWETWCGPSPLVPFNIERFREGQHRYFKEYVGSWMHELGPHIMDLAFWATKAGAPKAVSATGGKFVTTDISTIPDTLDAVLEYDGFTMTWMSTCGNTYDFGLGGPAVKLGHRNLGVIFQGLNGGVVANYSTYKVIPEADRMKPLDLPLKPAIPPSPGHHAEFVQSCRTREPAPCNVAYHYPLHVGIALAHIALKVGRKVHWDEEKGEILNDREANALCTPVYRKPWNFPAV